MLSLYTDENVLGSVIAALRSRGIDILTAWEDGRGSTDDRFILDRATELKRILYSQDTDLLAIAVARQRIGLMSFSGVVYAHQYEPIGQCVEDLELILSACTFDELRGSVLFVPLR